MFQKGFKFLRRLHVNRERLGNLFIFTVFFFVFFCTYYSIMFKAQLIRNHVYKEIKCICMAVIVKAASLNPDMIGWSTTM